MSVMIVAVDDDEVAMMLLCLMCWPRTSARSVHLPVGKLGRCVMNRKHMVLLSSFLL